MTMITAEKATSLSLPTYRLKGFVGKAAIFYIVFAINMIIWGMPTDVFNISSIFRAVGIQRLSIIVTFGVAIHYSMHRCAFLDFPGRWWLLVFLLGVVISFSKGVFDSSFSKHLMLTKVNNSLELYSIFKGVGLFFSIVILFRNYNQFLNFIKVELIIAGTFCLMSILGFSRAFVSLFGSIDYTMAYQSYLGVKYAKLSFPTMDSGNFSFLILGFLVLTLFLFLNADGYNKMGLLLLSLFGTSVIMTLTRANSLILGLCFPIFLVFYQKIQLRTAAILISVAFGLVCTALWTHIGNLIICRWRQIYDNIFSWLSGGTQLTVMDNFTWRLLAAQISLPSDLNGWLFGTGGIQVGYVPGFNSASHIEVTNWLSEYGLIGFAPLAGFHIALFRYLFKIKVAKYPLPIQEKLKLLRACGLTIFVLIWLEAMNMPLFIGLWFWSGIVAVICLISKDMIKKQAVASKAFPK